MLRIYAFISLLLLAPANSFAAPANQSKSSGVAPSSRIQALATVDPEKVAAFIRDLDPSPVTELTMTVGDFRVMDLNGDGRPDLLATLDYSGRDFYNTVCIVWADGSKLRLQKLDAWNLRSLQNVAEDLDGDGRMELILPEQLTAYIGAGAMATWHAVYTLDSQSQYVERSARFRTFYEQKELPLIESKIIAAQENPEGLEPDEAKNLVQALEVERDKIYRVLGRDSRAGMSSALEWAKSGDRVSRILALGVLEDIDDPVAARALQELSQDHDPVVKAQALGALEARRQHIKRYP